MEKSGAVLVVIKVAFLLANRNPDFAMEIQIFDPFRAKQLLDCNPNHRR